ncbi:metallophosphoesterase [Brucella pecoris]|uniref:3',5'-cyclic AMP phosphodiesterase CpdA n=1 Tax=Brucella pecoris TaxID=867683 RepID=A0A5C5CF77_9HYPH|nr:metallophosphoesterase [Brucella pecoris]MBB4095674.1 3',5'-cyclic AMP phosphodiesterase CpdA [Brucella pecoris]TNV09625.1 hypothetical protein FIB18_19415 [Brucella pecoris]
MSDRALFLHLTDAHLMASGNPLPRDDHKVNIPGITQETREAALEFMLSRLAERLKKEALELDGVLFSGDAQDKGEAGGHRILFELLIKHLADVGITPANIVAVPGNHDVLQDSLPSSSERYTQFVETWRTHDCVTPWIDGIDSAPTDGGSHALVAKDCKWAVYPINTSNWSQVSSILPAPLSDVWDKIPALLSDGDQNLATVLRKQLNGLARYDMARVSSAQLEALRHQIEATEKPAAGKQLRVALLHHHLRAPSLREELKPFADMSNLEQLRGFLRDRRIAIVIHGHKHEHAAQYEHLYEQDSEAHWKTLVISGSTFEAGRETDAARLISISGMPFNPTIAIEPLPLPRAGVDMKPAPLLIKRIWSDEPLPNAPVVIQGKDIDEVYNRACEAAATEAKEGTLIVHLDLPASSPGSLPLPNDYPIAEPLNEKERRDWLKELVAWWQLDRSGLDHRIPYVHGGRLRRFGGKIDQIARVKNLLREKASTRAVAVLVDPFRDFTIDGKGEEFASFCLVEFKRRNGSGGRQELDAIAFYRAQEFARWWPINVAELRFLQWEICGELGFTPGRITTISADARTQSRTPTQVAMPIIDRWLDQAPERIHLLAISLGHRTIDGASQSEAVLGWERTLDDLQNAASVYNPDGVPTAIEGLQLLATYLRVGNDGDVQIDEAVALIEDLANRNRTFERGSKDKSDFDSWSPAVMRAVQKLRKFTASRLEQPKKG